MTKNGRHDFAYTDKTYFITYFIITNLLSQDIEFIPIFANLGALCVVGEVCPE